MGRGVEGYRFKWTLFQAEMLTLWGQGSSMQVREVASCDRFQPIRKQDLRSEGQARTARDEGEGRGLPSVGTGVEWCGCTVQYSTAQHSTAGVDLDAAGAALASNGL